MSAALQGGCILFVDSTLFCLKKEWKKKLNLNDYSTIGGRKG